MFSPYQHFVSCYKIAGVLSLFQILKTSAAMKYRVHEEAMSCSHQSNSLDPAVHQIHLELTGHKIFL